MEKPNLQYSMDRHSRIVRALSSADLERIAAALEEVQIRPQSTYLPALLEMEKKEMEPLVLIEWVKAVAVVDKKKPFERIIKYLRHHNSKVRISCVQALSLAGLDATHTKILGVLMNFLSDPEEQVVACCRNTLVDTLEEEDLLNLIDQYFDPRDEIRPLNSLKLISSLGLSECYEIVKSCLQNPSHRVRSLAEDILPLYFRDHAKAENNRAAKTGLSESSSEISIKEPPTKASQPQPGVSTTKSDQAPKPVRKRIPTSVNSSISFHKPKDLDRLSEKPVSTDSDPGQKYQKLANKPVHSLIIKTIKSLKSLRENIKHSIVIISALLIFSAASILLISFQPATGTHLSPAPVSKASRSESQLRTNPESRAYLFHGQFETSPKAGGISGFETSSGRIELFVPADYPPGTFKGQVKAEVQFLGIVNNVRRFHLLSLEGLEQQTPPVWKSKIKPKARIRPSTWFLFQG